MQADVLNSPLMIVARTDAEDATMIDSTIDPIDHPHIKGVTVKGVEPLYEAIKKGTDKNWEERAGCMTFPDAVAKVRKAKGTDTAKWLKDSLKMSITEMRKAAAALGAGDVFFDWDTARSVEGYSLKMSITEMRKAAAPLGAGDVFFLRLGHRAVG